LAIHQLPSHDRAEGRARWRLLGTIDQYLPPARRGRAPRLRSYQTPATLIRAGATKRLDVLLERSSDSLFMAVHAIVTDTAGSVVLFRPFEIELAYRGGSTKVSLVRSQLDELAGVTGELRALDYPFLVPAGSRLEASLTNLGALPRSVHLDFAGAAIDP